MYVSKENRKILKYILKRGHITQHNIPYKFKGLRIQDLLAEHLLEIVPLVPPGEEGFEDGLYGYSVTPKGEDALKEVRSVQFKTNLSMILSIGAFFISILVAFTPFPDLCKAWIEAILKILQ